LRPPYRALAYVLVLGLLIGSFAYFTLVYARKVTGTSMYPTLEEGDMVVVVNVPYSSLKVGDIVVYDPPCSATGNSVIHRVVGVGAGGLLTKGDANSVTDQAGNIATGPVTAACIEGEVVFVIPYLEKLAFLPYDVNYMLAAAVVVMLIIGELHRSRKTGQVTAESVPFEEVLRESDTRIWASEV
jgi:signal peptidase I